MPGIVAGALVAHPPVLVPEVGGERSAELRATHSAVERLDRLLSRNRGELVVLISPHSASSLESIPVRRSSRVAGDLGRFGAPQVRVVVDVDVEATEMLVRDAGTQGFALTWSDDANLDHGIVVPLYLLPRTRAARRFILLGISGWPLDRFREFGAFLHRQLGSREAILIASGDLSHRLTPEAPYGFRPEGQVMDQRVIDALRTQQWDQIERLDPGLVGEAGECGLRPLSLMLGAARAAGLRSEVFSYEGPFGVGYPVALFRAEHQAGAVQAIGQEAIETYLRERRIIDPPASVPPDLKQPSAAFVTLRKHGELRGCMGSVLPTESSAAREIIRYAIASAVRDPRFEPVQLDEVPELTVSAQLLDPPEPVASVKELDPAVYGVIVRSGDRQGLLLPGIEGIETVAEQIAAVCEKAGINQRGPLRLERFRTRTVT
jgi:AmmeMemoRadiSam system protein A